MEKEFFDSLIVRSLTEGLSANDQRLLEQARQEDDALDERYNQLLSAWERSGKLALIRKIDVRTAADFQKVWSRIETQPVRPKWYAIQRSLNKSIAAALVALLMTASFVLVYRNVPGFGRWEAYSSQNKIESIQLPDRSVVTLNKFSRVVFLINEGEEKRLVKIKGEAFFEVASNPDKPFVVDAGKAKVRVVGTAFNLKSDEKRNFAEVSVSEGTVSFSSGKEKIILTRGETGVFFNGHIQKVITENLNTDYWKTGQLVFTNASLEAIAKVLVDEFDEIVEYKHVGRVSNVVVTTRFENQSLDQIFQELELHFSKKFELKNGILVISD